MIPKGSLQGTGLKLTAIAAAFLGAIILTIRVTNGTAKPRSSRLLVSAAASLTDAFTEIGRAFTESTGIPVRLNFASSGALQQQIQAGAPVDVFASAGLKEMDSLQREREILPGTRVIFASNRLVLITPPRSRVRGWADLRLPTVQRVAISDPGSVPSGRYAEETLTHRGLWPAVRAKAVLGENVRQTLQYVVAGDVDAGIVFATDAAIARGRVLIAAEAIPGVDHRPILYPAAVVSAAPDAVAAHRFLVFLQSSTAQAILRRYDFSPEKRRAAHRGAQ